MRKDFEYLCSVRKYVLVVVVIFILSIITGLLESEKNPELSKNLLEPFEKLINWIKTINPPILQTMVLLMIIFLNNALKSLAAIFLGVGFGIFPLYLVAINGEAVGIVTNIFSREKGILYVLAALLPHGIIEIPAILISAGMGLRLGHMVYLSLRGLQTDIRSELRLSIRFYIRVIAPLLFIAAMVETFITPLIAFQFMTR